MDHSELPIMDLRHVDRIEGIEDRYRRIYLGDTNEGFLEFRDATDPDTEGEHLKFKVRKNDHSTWSVLLETNDQSLNLDIPESEPVSLAIPEYIQTDNRRIYIDITALLKDNQSILKTPMLQVAPLATISATPEGICIITQPFRLGYLESPTTPIQNSQ